MNIPHFLINTYLESNKGNLEELRKKLFEKGVLTKDYMDSDLMLIYHKYDSPITSELERECRSLVIDRSTLKIVSYSCETPRLNKDGMEYLISHSTNDQIINQCFEGTYLTIMVNGMFLLEDVWMVKNLFLIKLFKIQNHIMICLKKLFEIQDLVVFMNSHQN